MLFLMISVPATLLCAYLFWLTWRRHRRVAVVVGISGLVFLGVAVASLAVTLFCYEVIAGIPAAG